MAGTFFFKAHFYQVFQNFHITGADKTQPPKTPPLQSHIMYLVSILTYLFILTPFQPSVNSCIFQGRFSGGIKFAKDVENCLFKIC